MFGYVQTDKDDLRVREYALYRAYYCGLCRTLQKRYGFAAKFILNYDCTFAFILLTMTAGNAPVIGARCPFNPLRREKMADITPEAEFAAALNVITAYKNAEDKLHDDRSVLAWLFMLIFKRAYKKAAKRYPEAAEGVEAALTSLHETERAGSGDIDMAAQSSADMLSGALSAYHFPDDVSAHIMKKLCGDLGRWIYAADAWTDRVSDAKKGSYNPINVSGMDRESMQHYLYTCLAHMKDAFDLLDVKADDGTQQIAENILCRGCVTVTERVLADKYNTERKRRRKHGSI